MIIYNFRSDYQSDIFIESNFFHRSDCCSISEDVFVSVLRAVGVNSTVLSRCGLQTFKASLGDDDEKQKWCCLIVQATPKVKNRFIFSPT